MESKVGAYGIPEGRRVRQTVRTRTIIAKIMAFQFNNIFTMLTK